MDATDRVDKPIISIDKITITCILKYMLCL